MSIRIESTELTIPNLNWQIEELPPLIPESTDREAEKAPRPILDNDQFLQELRKVFEINRIFYPGAGTDDCLEAAFDSNEIYYLDKSYKEGYQAYFWQPKDKNYRRLTTNTYGRYTFQDKFFDAIYFKDNHASGPEFTKMLQTLKPGGIIIVGSTCEGTMNIQAFDRRKSVVRINLPFKGEDDWETEYRVYQKVSRRQSANMKPV